MPLEPHGRQVLGRLFWVEVGKLCLYLGADGDGILAVDLELLAQLVLVAVGHVENGLHGEQEEVMGGGALVVGHVHLCRAMPLVEPRLQALCHLETRRHLLVALGLLLQLGDGALERAQVRKDKLGLDGVNVCRRVDKRAGTARLA